MDIDSVTKLAAFATVAVSVWSLVISYRTAAHQRYNSVVTAERIKWVTDLREAAAKFCGAVQTWRHGSAAAAPADTIIELVEGIDFQGSRIRLLLDPRYDADRQIEASVLAISRYVHGSARGELPPELDTLISQVQAHTNGEWVKVKREAKTLV